MEKLYALIFTIIFSSIIFGQNGSNKGFEILKSQLSHENDLEKAIPTPPQQNKKAPGDTIWSEDFTNGFPSGWSVYDSTGNNYNWVINPGLTNITAEFTNASPIASNSGGNYMLLFGDEYNQPLSSGIIDMNAFFQTSAITLSGQQGINVNFQQKLRRCCANSGVIAVLMASTDPTFTTNVSSYDITGGLSGAVGSPDPMDMSINISDIAGGLNGDIYLRFYIGGGISHYYWMIDDIYIVESPVNDIEVSNAFYGFNGYQYTAIPQSQIQPMDFSIQANNIGSADQTGTFFEVDINDGNSSIHVSTTIDTTLNSLSTHTFYLDSLWTPPNSPLNSPYTPTLCVLSDSTDETPQNNCIGFPPFQVTWGLLALDDFSATPGNGGGTPGPNNVTEYEAGNQFEIINQDEELYAIDVVTGTNTPVGTFIDVVIYQIDFSASPETYTEIWRSPGYSINAADLGAVKHFTDYSNGCYIATLLAGETYFAAVHSYADFEFGTSGTNPLAGTPSARHSAIRYPNMVSPNANSSFGLSSTPMIRLEINNICDDIETLEYERLFKISPNPTSGKFTISFDSEEQDVYTLSVKNVIGQIVMTKELTVAGKTKEEVSLANHKKGIYLISLTNKKGTQTSKLIVE